MRLEALINNIDTSNYEIQQLIYCACEYKFNTVSIPLFLLSTYKEYCGNLNIAVPISFPNGISISQIKCHEMIKACHSGASILDLTLNSYYIKHGNYREIQREIDAASAISLQNNVELRVVVDYRSHEPNILLELSKLVAKTNVSTIITNSGVIVDDITDNLVNCVEIKEKIGIKTGLYVHGCSKNDFLTIKKCKIDVLRFSSEKLIDKLMKK